MPRWVKVMALLAAVVVAILVVAMLLGGEHGPGRHLTSAAGPTELVTSSVTDHTGEQLDVRAMTLWR
ncbi:hypothetical protein [Kineococcus rubinsiae]|uniref:hypothetical protein n=1 Tax=Kineococcus rubinsiae TaxID=2609562 RepID=UPI00143181F9|nr:hypothetical protein [Kineococcus rubinsiae]NIZ93179.1 hypothetical protein [Kineococcus rubinsiae]